MDIRQLQHFLAVIETGSFHKAAIRMNLTQQAISRSLQRLEKECGGRLLERKRGDRRKVGPSPFGLLLIPRAQKALAELKGFRDEIETLMGTGRELVRLGAAPTATRSLLPAAIRLFRAKRPQARVQLICQVTHVILDNLAGGVYDMAICDEPDEKLDPQFVGEPLFTDHNVIVARAGHALLDRGRLDLNELLDSEWIVLGPFCRLWNELRDIYLAAGLTYPTLGIETSSVELTIQHLLEHDCLSFLPACLINAELNSGELVELPVRRPPPRTWSTLLVTRAGSTPSAPLADFMDVARKAAKSLPRAKKKR